MSTLSIELILIGCLGACLVIFFMQSVMQFGMKIDAGWIFGFSYFFDLTGYLYKTYVHGSSLFLLLAVPMFLLVVAFLDKPKLGEDLFTNQGIKLWLVFLLYSVISVNWAYNDDFGIFKLQIISIHGIIPGIFTFIIYKMYRTFTWTPVVLFGLGYSIIHHLFGEYPAEYPGRLTLPGGNPIYDARILFAAVTIAIWGKRIPLVLRLVTIGFGIYSGIATQSRGPLLALLVANGCVLLMVLFIKYMNKKLHINKWVKVGAFALVLIGAFTAWHYNDQLQEVIGTSRFTVLVNQDELVGDANYLGRKYLQKEAWDQFISHPFFGTGLGGNDIMGNYNYPHNIVLEIASQLGLVGMTLWLIALVYSCFIAKHSGVLLALLIQSVISALFSGDFGYNYEYILIAITALALAPKQNVKDVERNGKDHLHTDGIRLRRSGGAGRSISNGAST